MFEMSDEMRKPAESMDTITLKNIEFSEEGKFVSRKHKKVDIDNEFDLIIKASSFEATQDEAGNIVYKDMEQDGVEI